MAVSNCNKEVATRLYRMLAISELEADRVKSDHASFAKLGLLTQQAQLLQRQAVQVVNKSVLKAEKDELAGLSTMSTALTTEDSAGAKRVLAVLAVNEKTQATIERDQPASAKLSLLADQVDFLQEQAQQVVDDAELNARLTEIGKGSVCRLVPGTTYFHYTQNGREALSRVSPDEWTNYDTYHGKYLYDFDFAFRRLLDEDMETEPAEQLLPRVVATQPQALCFSEPEPVAAPVPVAPAPICSVLSRW